MMTKTVCCPQCGSKSLYKDGLRYLNDGDTVQRWLCKSCGYRFSDLNSKEDCSCSSVRNVQKIPTSSLKKPNALPYSYRVGVTQARGAKNLVKVETRIQKRAAGATTSAGEVKGRIVEFLWHLKKNGYSSSTIKLYNTWLLNLVKHDTDLQDPESVKETIALQKSWSASSKNNVVAAYNSFADFLGLRWTPPKYKVQRKLPFIPLESEIDALIAGAGKKTAALLHY